MIAYVEAPLLRRQPNIFLEQGGGQPGGGSWRGGGSSGGAGDPSGVGDPSGGGPSGNPSAAVVQAGVGSGAEPRRSEQHNKRGVNTHASWRRVRGARASS